MVTERDRSYSWEDPTALARAGTQMSGLEYLRAMHAGDLPHPPVCATVGFRLWDSMRGVQSWNSSQASISTTRSAPSTGA